MGRIAGILEDNNFDQVKFNLKVMLQAMKHGNQDCDYIIGNNGLYFGNRSDKTTRDSILEQSSMQFVFEEIYITFDGEIYNYEEIKDELVSIGINFNSNSYVELINHAYLKWGVNAFSKFDGIFAFALFDGARNKLILARDFFGIKPLYYFLQDKQILFASEIRAFTSYDPQWIENPDWKIFFLAFGNIPQPFSTLKNVFSLPPGNYLEVDLNSYQSVMSTYDLASVSNWISEKEEVLGRIRNELKDSLHRRLKGDDNFALLLSGGLGSTILALIADCFKTKISTISINFAEHHFDEKDYQREVLNNTSHLYPTYLNVTSSMFWEQVNDFFKSLDQPSIDGINMYFVAECAQIEGFNSVVSGIGVDEIFGNSNTILKSLNFLRRLPYKNRLAKFLSNIKDSFGRLTYLDLKGATGDYLFLRGIFTIEQICKISGKDEYHIKSILKKVTLPRWFNSSDPLYKSYLESNFYLRNQLLKDANNMGSWHGITIRAPFLSTNIYKALQTIHPLKSYFKNGKKKLLVEAFKTILPTKIYRRKKNGFEFPIDSWLKNNETSLRRLTEDNFFTAEIIDQFLNNKIHWSKPWALAVISQHDQKKNKKCQKKKLVMVEN